MPEEKKIDNVAEEESDFADETKLEEIKPAEEEVKPEVQPEPEEPEPEAVPPCYDYDSDHLSKIDEARQIFLNTYKKKNTLKTVVMMILLVVILAGWLVPSMIEAWKNAALVIAMVVLAICLGIMGVYSYFFKKKSEVWIRDYFQTYYHHLYAYAIENIDVSAIESDMSMKITEDECAACKLYKDIYKVGSRYNASFKYHDLDCAIVDCAAQVRGEKMLQTAFVGKFLRTPNTYRGNGLYIYVKGNKRALPPTATDGMKVLEETKKHIIWGEDADRKYLTKAMKDKIFAIETNTVLVDFAISLQEGRTYFCLGYEDTLMVIPMEHQLDLNPIHEFKENFGKFLDIAEMFNKKGN